MYGALAKATQLADFAYSSQVRSVTVAKLNCDSLTASRALRKVKSLMGRGGRSRSNQPHSMISRGSGGCEGNAANSSARNTKWCIPLSGRDGFAAARQSEHDIVDEQASRGFANVDDAE